MRVFLDTNVVVAAVATRGLCADVVREVLSRHEIVVSQALLDEVAAVLSEKIGVPAEVIADLTALLREGAVFAAPSDDPRPPVKDRADGILLSAASNGQAEIFVTGDAEILELRGIGPMAVVSPRGFWERVRSVPKS